jgi:membrane fusion protein YbhG
MKKRIRIIVAVLVAAALGVWYMNRSDGPGDGVLSASGTVEATTADLGFQLPGRIDEIGVSEGDAVSAGQELARLDTRELDAMLDAARAQVDASGARLTELRLGARPQEVAVAEAAVRAAADRNENARREVERADRLFQGGAISAQALDMAETALAVSTATHEQAVQALTLTQEGPRAETVAAQRAMVGQADANLARAEATLGNAIVSAPFPGLVTTKHRQPGEIVGAGMPVLTLLDPDSRWVRIYVREDEIGRVQIGQRAEISSDTYPDRSYQGEVVFIGSEAEFTPRNVQTAEERIKLVYPVKVRITGDPDFELKPGVPADVTLIEAGS